MLSVMGRVSVTEVAVAPLGASTGRLLPVPLTKNCDELGEEVGVELHPENMLSPMALTTINRGTCKRRRFLNPRRHNTPASIVAGSTEPGRRLSPAGGTVSVNVVVVVPRAFTVTVAGENWQFAPTGTYQEQPRVIVPLKAAFAVMVSVVVPLPFGDTAIVVFAAVMVNAGGGKLMTYAADPTALAV